MPLGEFTQQFIAGENQPSDAEVDIESNGKQLRPITAMLSHLVDEFKLHVTEDGIWTRHVEPANVAMAWLHAHPAAFDSYELDGEEFLTGVYCDDLHDTVKDARKSPKDPVRIRLDERRTLVTIQRRYDMGRLEWTDRLLNLDPDSVRQEPNTVSIDELTEWTATIEVDALNDAIAHIKRVSDHLIICESDGHLVMHLHESDANETLGPLTAGDDESVRYSDSAADFGPVAEATEDGGLKGAESIMSLDFLDTQVSGLNDGDIDQVTLTWGEEVPLMMNFAEEDDDGTVLFEGELYVAPRIKSES